MSVTDFLRWPLAVKVAFAVLIWPAVWAGALLAVAFAGDMIRRARKREGSQVPGAALLRG
jgi:hypothetical protein